MKYLFRIATICTMLTIGILMICFVLIAAENESLAEKIAPYAYYALVAAVTFYYVDHLRHSKE